MAGNKDWQLIRQRTTYQALIEKLRNRWSIEGMGSRSKEQLARELCQAAERATYLNIHSKDMLFISLRRLRLVFRNEYRLR